MYFVFWKKKKKNIFIIKTEHFRNTKHNSDTKSSYTLISTPTQITKFDKIPTTIIHFNYINTYKEGGSICVNYHDEGDLEIGEKAQVGMKERDGVGDLDDSVVLRRDSPQKDSVDRRRLVLSRL